MELFRGEGVGMEGINVSRYAEDRRLDISQPTIVSQLDDGDAAAEVGDV
jgi:hypothetical protein